jgi:hypothetical protein
MRHLTVLWIQDIQYLKDMVSTVLTQEAEQHLRKELVSVDGFILIKKINPSKDPLHMM